MNTYSSHLIQSLVILQLNKEAKRIMYHTIVHVLRQSQPSVSRYQES